MVKNLPDNAGDVGSIPGLERSHMPWGNQAHAPPPLSRALESVPVTREGTTVRSLRTTARE